MQTNAVTQTPKFLTRTTLLPGEYRANFRQIDRDAITLVRSKAARQVTKMMAHIYLCLLDAPLRLREREGVLRFAGEVREGKTVTAWEQLIELLEVADGTAHKALEWMREQRLIGYHSGKNGVGIRIFLNRAAESVKLEAERNQKNLRLIPASNGEAPVSSYATPFRKYRRENVDQEIKTPAPENGAVTHSISEFAVTPEPTLPDADPQSLSVQEDVGSTSEAQTASVTTELRSTTAMNEIVSRLRAELVPYLHAVAAQAATHAATQAAANEVGRTREWFETRALPKVARVVQAETYDLLRRHGTLDERERRVRADLQVGRSPTIAAVVSEYKLPELCPLTQEEVLTAAETCVALREVQGREVEALLVEMSAAKGGWLLAEDVSRVRDAAKALLLTRNEGN